MFFKAVKYFFCITGVLVAAFIALGILIIALLTIFEYKPADVEDVAVSGSASGVLKKGEPFKIVSWNIGYGDLGDNADFFMDGGKHVFNSTKARVSENLNSICKNISLHNPDIVFVQEVDARSRRSHRIDERKIFSESFKNNVYSYAQNYKAFFVPFPIPPLGKVDSGLMTLSRFGVEQAQRIKLPSFFKWPVRTANLKRCLLLNRIPIEGTGKELVLINLHLEAFDSGEGKVAQTKALLNVMEEEYKKGNYVIVGGDFNQVFSSTDVSKYKKRNVGWAPGFVNVDEFDSHWNFIQDSTKPTCRANSFPYKDATPEQIQYFVIDGFIVSDNVQVESAQTVDYNFVNSDHNPVVIRAELK